ncbi:nuclear transport factor 2 family protein, partial [Nocardia sp. NPDC051990]|uniref:nuclear transport factor 2 family protein n=1 Tax=Nocardia sp. NPDC051990 TaxID=3155285 RepID=UPI0034228F2F
MTEFAERVLRGADCSVLTDYICTHTYRQHNPDTADGLDGCGTTAAAWAEQGKNLVYRTIHRVVADGNLVLVPSEGQLGEPLACWDLFRIADGKIVEHRRPIGFAVELIVAGQIGVEAGAICAEIVWSQVVSVLVAVAVAARRDRGRVAPDRPDGSEVSAMMAILQDAVPIATLIFVVSSMVAMGLGLTISEITAPLRNLRLVAMSLLANFVLMPAAAVLLAKILHLDEPFGVGLLLLGAAAGAPFLPKLAQIAKGDLAFAVALMVVLMVITVGYLPLVLPLLLPGV